MTATAERDQVLADVESTLERREKLGTWAPERFEALGAAGGFSWPSRSLDEAQAWLATIGGTGDVGLALAMAAQTLAHALVSRFATAPARTRWASGLRAGTSVAALDFAQLAVGGRTVVATPRPRGGASFEGTLRAAMNGPVSAVVVVVAESSSGPVALVHERAAPGIGLRKRVTRATPTTCRVAELELRAFEPAADALLAVEPTGLHPLAFARAYESGVLPALAVGAFSRALALGAAEVERRRGSVTQGERFLFAQLKLREARCRAALQVAADAWPRTEGAVPAEMAVPKVVVLRELPMAACELRELVGAREGPAAVALERAELAARWLATSGERLEVLRRTLGVAALGSVT